MHIINAYDFLSVLSAKGDTYGNRFCLSPRRIYFFCDEIKAVKFVITELPVNSECFITVYVNDYNSNTVYEKNTDASPDKEGRVLLEYELPLKRLGYYNFFVTVRCGGIKAEKSTGLGVTTRHKRSGFESVFGVSCNFWHPEQDMPLYERVGVRFVRNPGKDTTVKWRKCIEESGMYSQVQLQGNDMSRHYIIDTSRI